MFTNMETQVINRIKNEDTEFLPHYAIPCDFDGERVMYQFVYIRWMEMYSTENKRMNIYNITNRSFKKDCIINKNVGYLSHIKLYGDHLIMVANHKTIIVYLVLFIGIRYERKENI